MTMAFLTCPWLRFFISFNMRSQRGTLFRMKKKNLFLLGSMAFSWILTTVIIYVPFLANIFEFEHISLAEYGVALLLAISIIPMVEIVKFFQRRGKRRLS